MKLIVQLRKNAYAFELSCAKVQMRMLDEEEELEDEDEVPMRQDPTGTVYSQIERAQPDVDMANTHHCDEIRATKPSFGFGR